MAHTKSTRQCKKIYRHPTRCFSGSHHLLTKIIETEHQAQPYRATFKTKRRIQNKLRTLESNTKIRGENLLNKCLQQPMAEQIPSMTGAEYKYLINNETRFKTEVCSISKLIIYKLRKLKLEPGFRKTCRNWYWQGTRRILQHKEKTNGNKSTNITCMEYLGKRETTE